MRREMLDCVRRWVIRSAATGCDAVGYERDLEFWTDCNA